MLKETIKKEWYIIILLIVPFGASAYLWNDLPDMVPTHFNIYGEADDWGPKWVNAIMFPAIGLATYLSLIFLPFIDPKKRIESRQKSYCGNQNVIEFIHGWVICFYDG